MAQLRNNNACLNGNTFLTLSLQHLLILNVTSFTQGITGITLAVANLERLALLEIGFAFR